VVREELAVLADHGMNLTRSFCYWPDFHPEPDRLNQEMVERLADFLDRHTGARWSRPGPPSGVFGDPQHPYTRTLLASVPQLHRKWDRDERRLVSEPAGEGSG
jgi:oligopeptide/dipeptide transporter